MGLRDISWGDIAKVAVGLLLLGLFFVGIDKAAGDKDLLSVRMTSCPERQP